jgi:acetyl-CoA synthetase
MVQASNLAVRPVQGRGLTTARAVLKVLTFLRQHPEGVRAGEVAELIGKSVSTAYYLLASLCEEGFAVRDPRAGRYRPVPEQGHETTERPRQPGEDLSEAVDSLLLRTHKRSYLGQMKHGALEIVAVRGRQGMPRIPGLGTRILECAHAVAMGKIVLAFSSPEAQRRYADRGLRQFTAATLTSPEALTAELTKIRHQGFAVEREEFQADFCCVAAPIRGAQGRCRAVLGLSSTTHAYDTEREQLVEAVMDVARLSSTCRKPSISCLTAV